MKKIQAPEWLEDCVFYEIYPQSFKDSNGDGIGDLPGITEKLPYIKECGFNALWLNPCFASPFRDAGYDISDFFRIAPRYGTNEDAGTLFRKAHELGMKVILDLVICHTALEHPAVAESGKVTRNEWSDFYIWCPQISYRGDTNEDEYYVSGWAPRGSYRASFFAVQPSINYGFNVVKHPWEMRYDSPACLRNQEYIKKVMRFWLDLGCDGFRVDMAGQVIKRDPNQAKTIAFWQNIRNMFDREYPEAILVSEWFNPARSLKAGFHIDFYGGDVFRNDNWMSLAPHRTHVVFAREKTERASLAQWLSGYLEFLKAADGHGFIGMFSGNHDTWRLRYYSEERGILVKLAFLLTLPGCPFFYYGDEIGMRYLPECSTEGSGSRGGSRTPMQWNHSRNLGFSDGAPENLYLPVDSAPDAPTVADALGGKNAVYPAVRSLLALRHEKSALQATGKLEILHGSGGRFPLVYRRSRGKSSILVALNPTGEQLKFRIGKNSVRVLLQNGSTLSAGSLLLEPESFCILEETVKPVQK